MASSAKLGIPVPQMLPVTGTWALPFASYMLFLMIRTVRARQATNCPLGENPKAPATEGEDGKKKKPKTYDPLLTAGRSHANFMENVPMALIMAGMAELNGADRTWLNYTLGMFFVARIAHAEFGLMMPGSNGAGRGVGMTPLDPPEWVDPSQGTELSEAPLCNHCTDDADLADSVARQPVEFDDAQDDITRSQLAALKQASSELLHDMRRSHHSWDGDGSQSTGHSRKRGSDQTVIASSKRSRNRSSSAPGIDRPADFSSEKEFVSSCRPAHVSVFHPLKQVEHHYPSKERPLPKWMSQLPSNRASDKSIGDSIPRETDSSNRIVHQQNGHTIPVGDMESSCPTPQKPPPPTPPSTLMRSTSPPRIRRKKDAVIAASSSSLATRRAQPSLSTDQSRSTTPTPARGISSFPFFQNPKAPLTPAMESSWNSGTLKPSPGLSPYGGLQSRPSGVSVIGSHQTAKLEQANGTPPGRATRNPSLAGQATSKRLSQRYGDHLDASESPQQRTPIRAQTMTQQKDIEKDVLTSPIQNPGDTSSSTTSQTPICPICTEPAPAPSLHLRSEASQTKITIISEERTIVTDPVSSRRYHASCIRCANCHGPFMSATPSFVSSLEDTMNKPFPTLADWTFVGAEAPFHTACLAEVTSPEFRNPPATLDISSTAPIRATVAHTNFSQTSSSLSQVQQQGQNILDRMRQRLSMAAIQGKDTSFESKSGASISSSESFGTDQKRIARSTSVCTSTDSTCSVTPKRIKDTNVREYGSGSGSGGAFTVIAPVSAAAKTPEVTSASTARKSSEEHTPFLGKRKSSSSISKIASKMTSDRYGGLPGLFSMRMNPRGEEINTAKPEVPKNKMSTTKNTATSQKIKLEDSSRISMDSVSSASSATPSTRMKRYGRKCDGSRDSGCDSLKINPTTVVDDTITTAPTPMLQHASDNALCLDKSITPDAIAHAMDKATLLRYGGLPGLFSLASGAKGDYVDTAKYDAGGKRVSGRRLNVHGRGNGGG
ncbi:hypothetical protein MMC25_000772 [Agyrium rufum]|nr:hypothetical protein [Agyrium rufum]